MINLLQSTSVIKEEATLWIAKLNLSLRSTPVYILCLQDQGFLYITYCDIALTFDKNRKPGYIPFVCTYNDLCLNFIELIETRVLTENVEYPGITQRVVQEWWGHPTFQALPNIVFGRSIAESTNGSILVFALLK